MRTAVSAICFFLLAATGFCFHFRMDANQPPKKITLVFHHQVGKSELVLDDTVKNILGDAMVIERFRYYVSNFSITDKEGKTVVLPVEYFLVDEADPESKKITLTIPGNNNIGSIHFLLGVDSIRNVSGIQTGALDPSKGMFWTWNTGYVMAKLEGSSEAVHSPGNRFTYHIGGFRNGMNVAKQIELKIPDGVAAFETINITADINKWFKGNSELKIAETPVCHGPGALAMRIADNYSGMFTINSVQ